MVEVEVKYGKVLESTIDQYQAGKKIIIHKGGTGSGKTYDIMIFLIFLIALEKPNKVITVVSESHPHLEIGVIRIMKDLLIKAGIFDYSQFNASKGFYQFHNGTILEFFSADRIGKALGARRYYLYGNEINSLKFDIWDELARRSENIIGDFNPTSEFWLEKFLEYYGDHEVIKSNYKDNPFLPDVEIKRIERRAEMDQNFKRIHIDCEYGIFEGLVFKNWTQIDEFPGIPYTYGLDFGYTNDPSALVKVGIRGDNLYLDEQFYETGLTNYQIREKLFSLNVGLNEVIADSADPKSIDEIFRSPYDRLGRFNIRPSIKGPDSINFGINKMQEYRMHVTKRSTNLIKELRNYAWQVDKRGETINKPVDSFNHAIDAVRYAVTHKKSSSFTYTSG